MKTIYINIKLFLRNWYFVYCKNRNVPHSFAGYGKYYLAKKYADKRTRATSPDGVIGRKRHFCFPYSNNIIMVCNRTEINKMIKAKLLRRDVNINYMIEHAFYISK